VQLREGLCLHQAEVTLVERAVRVLIATM
jgi:hypothetical protein